MRSADVTRLSADVESSMGDSSTRVTVGLRLTRSFFGLPFTPHLSRFADGRRQPFVP